MIRTDVFIDEFKNEKPTKKLIRFATIPSGYTSGRPRLIFDGESVQTGKKYPKLKSYTPKPLERVLVLNGVVIGAIE